jgi:hypothetical protein
MVWLLAGVFLIGLFVVPHFCSVWRRRADRRFEVRQRPIRDAVSLKEFADRMRKEAARGGSHSERQQLILDAAVSCTGAVCGIVYEPTDHRTLRAIAVAGLFPRVRQVNEKRSDLATTRARFVEAAFRQGDVSLDDDVAGRVAQSGREELWIDQSHERSADPTPDQISKLGSAMAVPLATSGQRLNVLVVGRFPDEAPFGPEDMRLLLAMVRHSGLRNSNDVE